MKLSVLHSRLPKRSLLFIAVGLFLLSFISAWYFKVQPSVQHQQKLLQQYVTKQLKDAKRLLQDSVLMRKLVLKTESLEEAKRISDYFFLLKPYQITRTCFFGTIKRYYRPTQILLCKTGIISSILTMGITSLIRERFVFRV